MAIAVSDARSNANDQIAHVANALRSSALRKKVFVEIYRGKKKAKTVAELMKATKLSQVAVLQQGGEAGRASHRESDQDRWKDSLREGQLYSDE